VVNKRTLALVSDMADASAHVRLATPMYAYGVECPTYEMYELVLHVMRSGSESEINRLRSICKQATDIGRETLTMSYMGELSAQEHTSEDMRENPAYVRLTRTLARMCAERGAARTMEHERVRDTHKRTMRPMGSHVCPPGTMSVNVDPVVAGVREAAGSVHRRSVAQPHTPLYTSVQKGILCDSARNCGMLTSKSVSPTRRGGRKHKCARLLQRLQDTDMAVQDALLALRARLSDK
jgi:hypothetical protein